MSSSRLLTAQLRRNQQSARDCPAGDKAGAISRQQRCPRDRRNNGGAYPPRAPTLGPPQHPRAYAEPGVARTARRCWLSINSGSAREERECRESPGCSAPNREVAAAAGTAHTRGGSKRGRLRVDPGWQASLLAAGERRVGEVGTPCVRMQRANASV